MKSIIQYIILFLGILLCLVGCGISTQSLDLALNNASLHIDKAQKEGAEQFASAEFDEAKTLLQSALSAKKDKQKVILAERSYAKARLAESLAKQIKAENEANKFEEELKIIEEKANRVRLERQTVEEELNQMMQTDSN
ncbi:TPA: DUF4398 domain-containing protein [bacterium]|jgi:hypothetical protein|nr:DUF4398 domain-containing protein [bacterium]